MSKTLAERVTDLREALNITQGKLAAEIGLDKSTMSRIENGTRKVSSDEVISLANFFNVPADYLLGRTDELIEPTLVKDQLTSIRLDDLPFSYRFATKLFIDFQREQFQKDLQNGNFSPLDSSK